MKNRVKLKPHRDQRLVVPIEGTDLGQRLDKAVKRLNADHPQWRTTPITRAALVRAVIDTSLDGWIASQMGAVKE